MNDEESTMDWKLVLGDLITETKFETLEDEFPDRNELISILENVKGKATAYVEKILSETILKKRTKEEFFNALSTIARDHFEGRYVYNPIINGIYDVCDNCQIVSSDQLFFFVQDKLRELNFEQHINKAWRALKTGIRESYWLSKIHVSQIEIEAMYDMTHMLLFGKSRNSNISTGEQKGSNKLEFNEHDTENDYQEREKVILLFLCVIGASALRTPLVDSKHPSFHHVILWTGTWAHLVGSFFQKLLYKLISNFHGWQNLLPIAFKLASSRSYHDHGPSKLAFLSFSGNTKQSIQAILNNIERRSALFIRICAHLFETTEMSKILNVENVLIYKLSRWTKSVNVVPFKQEYQQLTPNNLHKKKVAGASEKSYDTCVSEQMEFEHFDNNSQLFFVPSKASSDIGGTISTKTMSTNDEQDNDNDNNSDNNYISGKLYSTRLDTIWEKEKGKKRKLSFSSNLGENPMNEIDTELFFQDFYGACFVQEEKMLFLKEEVLQLIRFYLREQSMPSNLFSRDKMLTIFNDRVLQNYQWTTKYESHGNIKEYYRFFNLGKLKLICGSLLYPSEFSSGIQLQDVDGNEIPDNTENIYESNNNTSNIHFERHIMLTNYDYFHKFVGMCVTLRARGSVINDEATTSNNYDVRNGNIADNVINNEKNAFTSKMDMKENELDDWTIDEINLCDSGSFVKTIRNKFNDIQETNRAMFTLFNIWARLKTVAGKAQLNNRSTSLMSLIRDRDVPVDSVFPHEISRMLMNPVISKRYDESKPIMMRENFDQLCYSLWDDFFVENHLDFETSHIRVSIQVGL